MVTWPPTFSPIVLLSAIGKSEGVRELFPMDWMHNTRNILQSCVITKYLTNLSA